MTGNQSILGSSKVYYWPDDIDDDRGERGGGGADKIFPVSSVLRSLDIHDFHLRAEGGRSKFSTPD